MEESEPLGAKTPISDFSRRLVIYSSLLGSIFAPWSMSVLVVFKSVPFLFFFEIQLLYEVVLVSGVQQSDSYIYSLSDSFRLLQDIDGSSRAIQ